MRSLMLTTPIQLGCAETSASNRRTTSLYDLHGLMAWIHALPYGAGDAGGDVNYVSLCPDCNIARIALADVSGHGHAVAALGDMLRQLMQRYLSDLRQQGLMKELNRAVHQRLDQVHYATMLAAGWHRRRGLLVMTNAGHPPPLWYRASRQEWCWLETQHVPARGRRSSLPLGLLPDVEYDRRVIKPGVGDLVVMYSDGVSEAASPDGSELGRDGLMQLARNLHPDSADTFGTHLSSALAAFRNGNQPQDDHTIIVLRAS
jgi:sigma-B regulation protein RsbU (phosphoserine phosphatase)